MKDRDLNKYFNNLSNEYIRINFFEGDYYVKKGFNYNTDNLQEFSFDSTTNISSYEDHNIGFLNNRFYLQSSEVFNLNKLIPLEQYLCDYKDIVSSDVKSWYDDQYKIVHSILNPNKRSTFYFFENLLYKKVMYCTTKGSSAGRVYATSSSIQYMSKEIRSFLFKDMYLDFDIENSLFSMTAEFAKIYNIEELIPNIIYYIKNREEVLTIKMEKDNICRDVAKKNLIIAFNSRYNYAKKLGYFCDKINYDSEKIRKHIISTNKLMEHSREILLYKYLNDEKKMQEFNKLVKNNNMDEFSIKLYSLIYQTREASYLMNFYSYLLKQIHTDIENSYEKELYLEIYGNPPTNLDCKFSFVPFFDGAYIFASNKEVLDRIPLYVESYNINSINEGSYIQYKQKNIESCYKKLNIDILEKYVEINSLIQGSTSRQFNIILKKFNIKPFSLSVDKIINEDNYLDIKFQAVTFRRSIYNKLLELSLEEIKSFLVDDNK